MTAAFVPFKDPELEAHKLPQETPISCRIFATLKTSTVTYPHQLLSLAKGPLPASSLPFATQKLKFQG